MTKVMHLTLASSIPAKHLLQKKRGQRDERKAVFWSGSECFELEVEEEEVVVIVVEVSPLLPLGETSIWYESSQLAS